MGADNHLVTLGHRRIAFVTARFSPTTQALDAGRRETSVSLSLAAPDGLRFGVPPRAVRLGGRLRHRAATLPRGRSKALFAHSDSEAIGMVERAPDRGLTVRGGLAVVSYDDEVAAASGPSLTALRTQRRRLGSQAAETVLARMADPTKRPIHRLELWPNLVVRASCGGEERAFSSSDG
ncbi:hypothetical protein DMH15_08415 [Streptomyces sp. WAC 06725]|uniref:substrate-binding domain-containing protein n=1 Tax=Streptomyces sp. WAC 06725 TaxID=2203209 RepID=UPI000F738A77|nr:hypothetical protein DMH15_08415 [Streptomyces sp. WAC 06725]